MLDLSWNHLRKRGATAIAKSLEVSGLIVSLRKFMFIKKDSVSKNFLSVEKFGHPFIEAGLEWFSS